MQNRHAGARAGALTCSRADLGQFQPSTIHVFSFFLFLSGLENSYKIVEKC
jgi:hypothetical protein